MLWQGLESSYKVYVDTYSLPQTVNYVFSGQEGFKVMASRTKAKSIRLPTPSIVVVLW